MLRVNCEEIAAKENSIQSELLALKSSHRKEGETETKTTQKANAKPNKTVEKNNISFAHPLNCVRVRRTVREGTRYVQKIGADF